MRRRPRPRYIGYTEAQFQGMKINPHRITMALDAGGHYGPEVDLACDAEEPAVDEWEEGTSVPTFQQLMLLADLTEVPVSFFYQPDIEPFVGFLCNIHGDEPACEFIDERPEPTNTFRLHLVPS